MQQARLSGSYDPQPDIGVDPSLFSQYLPVVAETQCSPDGQVQQPTEG